MMIWVSQSTTMFWKWALKAESAEAEQRQVWKGLKVAWTVRKSAARYGSSGERAHLQKQVCGGFKGCIHRSRDVARTFDFPSEVQSILWEALMVKHMHSFCSSPSAVVKPQIHSVSSIKRREGRRRRRGEEAGEQKLGFATVPSSYFIDVGRHRKRAAFTLACRVLLLARESKTISDFEKYGGSWRSHSRAGISRLCAATLSALHLGG